MTERVRAIFSHFTTYSVEANINFGYLKDDHCYSGQNLDVTTAYIYIYYRCINRGKTLWFQRKSSSLRESLHHLYIW